MPIERRAAGGANAPAALKESSSHKVMSTETHGRDLFYGSEKTARAYIQAHHPWLHVQPGTDWGDAGPMPDVVLVGPDGKEEYWNGEDWVTEDSLESKEPVSKAAPVVADIPAGAVAHWNGTEWVTEDGDPSAPDLTGIETEQGEL